MSSVARCGYFPPKWRFWKAGGLTKVVAYSHHFLAYFGYNFGFLWLLLATCGFSHTLWLNCGLFVALNYNLWVFKAKFFSPTGEVICFPTFDYKKWLLFNFYCKILEYFLFFTKHNCLFGGGKVAYLWFLVALLPQIWLKSGLFWLLVVAGKWLLLGNFWLIFKILTWQHWVEAVEASKVQKDHEDS